MTNLAKAVIGIGVAVIAFGVVSLLKEGSIIPGVTWILLGAAVVLSSTNPNPGSVRQKVSRVLVIVFAGAAVVLAILSLVRVFTQA